jgi:hypothetical protein
MKSNDFKERKRIEKGPTVNKNDQERTYLSFQIPKVEVIHLTPETM